MMKFGWQVVPFLIPGFFWCHVLSAQTITLHERDAVVWSQDQVVTGAAEGEVSEGLLYVNEDSISFEVSNDSFFVPVRVGEGVNTLVACTAGGTACSDTLRWTLGFELRPEAYVYATVSGRTVSLHGEVVANPDSAALSFTWLQDPGNPQPVSFAGTSDTVTSFTLAEGAPSGEYYFDWIVRAADEDTARARTFVTVDSAGIEPFDIRTDFAAWIDSAVVYEVTPYNFVAEGRFEDVTQRIPEVADLGINTVWLQPVFGTGFGGQGYDITDYFAVRADYGSAEDLHTLIETAHAYGMKVLLDFVPNHTSIRHPYAQDAIAHGEASHYYDFYQRTEDDLPYSRHYNTRIEGEMTFIYYFWRDLPNLNYSNPEVQRWMIEAGRHWVENFDIDGYRIDAVWGTNARNPEFMKAWRLALKRVKPEVLLLGEDKATDPSVFEERFDVAYDWYPEESWVSHWTWQTDFSTTSNPTIFNDGAEGARSGLLREALTNEGRGWHPRAKVLRFMENNDTFRFIATHGPQEVERTRMVAALLFSLHGIPLLYNGQEVGFRTHPYETFAVYNAATSMQSQDSRYGLFPYYRHLIHLRKSFPALYSDNFEEVEVGPEGVDGYVFAYRRWAGEENIFGVLNMSSEAATAELTLPVSELALEAEKTYYLTDLLTGDYLSAQGQELQSVEVSLSGYTAALYALADSVLAVPTPIEQPVSELPQEVVLEQNYPNPFNPVTRITFAVPQAGAVHLRVYDVLGREVVTLIDGVLPAGRHAVDFDGHGFPSGVYFYRLEQGGKGATKRMLLVK